MNAVPVIAVDGPGGTGKGTLCVALAVQFGWHFLDSGALYRAVALLASEGGIALDDRAALSRVASGVEIRFQPDPHTGESRTFLGERDVSEGIRTEDCGNAASRIAAWPEVREALLARQRAFRQLPGLVADGRDMGTVVFPDARLKLFLTASPSARAERRYKQLIGKGISVSLPRLSADIAERDKRDQERAVSPLKPAPDAVVIDTTGLDMGGVRKRALALVRDRVPEASEFI
jgi:cytidylate kinase